MKNCLQPILRPTEHTYTKKNPVRRSLVTKTMTREYYVRKKGDRHYHKWYNNKLKYEVKHLLYKNSLTLLTSFQAMSVIASK